MHICMCIFVFIWFFDKDGVDASLSAWSLVGGAGSASLQKQCMHDFMNVLVLSSYSTPFDWKVRIFLIFGVVVVVIEFGPDKGSRPTWLGQSFQGRVELLGWLKPHRLTRAFRLSRIFRPTRASRMTRVFKPSKTFRLSRAPRSTRASKSSRILRPSRAPRLTRVFKSSRVLRQSRASRPTRVS